MPDHIMQTDHDSKAKAQEGSADPYESVWMTHWIHRGCNSPVSASGAHSDFVDNDSKEENCESKLKPVLVQNADSWLTRSALYLHPANISGKGTTYNCQQGELVVASHALDSAKSLGTRNPENRAEIAHDTLAMSLRKTSNQTSGRDPFPMFSFNQKIDGSRVPKKDLIVYNGQASVSQINGHSGHGKTVVGANGPSSPPRLLRLGHTEIEFLSKNPQHLHDNVSQSAIQWSKPDESLEQKSLPVSMAFHDNLMRLTSNRVPYNITRGKPVQSRKKESYQSSLPATLRKHLVDANFTRLDQEFCNYQSYSTVLVCDEEMDNQLIARNSGKTSESLHLMEKDGAPQLHYPLATNGHFPVSVGEQDKLMHNSSVRGFSQSDATPSVTKLDESNDGWQFRCGLPAHNVHDCETLRICAMVDSLEAVPGGTSKLSQTTHQLLITKKTGINMLREDEMIKKSKRSTNSKVSALHKLVSLPVDIDSYVVKQGGKVQTLGNSMERGREVEVRNMNTDTFGLKGESSAETDIMDIDDCQAQDALLGLAASSSAKDFKVKQNLEKSQATVMMLGEKSQSFLEKTKLHDISQEHPSLLDEDSSMENRGLTTSRTESLDVENLLSCAEQPENLNSGQEDVTFCEASNRWVKRLKLNNSESLPCDTHNLKMGDKSASSENANKFGTIFNYDRNSSGPMLSKHVDKGEIEKAESLALERNRESYSTDLVTKEFRNQTLSHPWIRRWCRNQAVTTKPKPTATVICEPQILEASLDEFRRKKLPSIAAMALMGKATNCFQPCEFRKKGSVVVWNSDGF